MSSLTCDDILLSISYKCKGEYDRMLEILQKKEKVTIEDATEARANVRSFYIHLLSDRYPEELKSVNKPPLVLYYYGNLELLKYKYKLTCIGTRTPTLYQSETSFDLISAAEDHFNNELVIISGMAYGLDQMYMKAAMDKNAPVISIIGSGIDNPYPEDNQGIYDYCKSGKGLVLSEYPCNTSAKKENFVFRNRIIAALGNATFVAGGKRRSGSSTTVHLALELGKEILALPCNITDDDLTNQLIECGATPIISKESFIKNIEENSIEKIS